VSAPLVPSPLDLIGRRRFSFYPPIRNAQPNEWRLGAGSWGEVQVVNVATGGELWIPRQYVGAVSEAHGPLLIVGLTKELEYRAGALGPRVKRIIEMPRADGEATNTSPAKIQRPPGPAPVIGIRIEDREDSSMNKALITLGVGALVISLVAALLSTLARP